MKVSTQLAMRLGQPISTMDIALVEELEDRLAVANNKKKEAEDDKQKVIRANAPCHHGNNRHNCMRCEDESIY